MTDTQKVAVHDDNGRVQGVRTEWRDTHAPRLQWLWPTCALAGFALLLLALAWAVNR